jgi:hydrogenase nickel incorporation protein HypA/HybF
MHELALAQRILQIVEDAARGYGATRVRAVRLAIGQLSHAEPHALRFAFDVVTRGSLAEGARLDIHGDEGVAWCAQCCETVRVARLGEPCPRCGGYQLQVTGGTEMRVQDIEID